MVYSTQRVVHAVKMFPVSFFQSIGPAGQDTEVENRLFDTPQNQRAMHHAGGDEYHYTFGDDELFIFHPELDFSTQLMRVFIVRPEKAYNFGDIVFMRIAQVFGVWFTIPGAIHLESPGNHVFIHPEYPCRKFRVLFYLFRAEIRSVELRYYAMGILRFNYGTVPPYSGLADIIPGSLPE